MHIQYKNIIRCIISNIIFALLCSLTLLSACKTSGEILDDNFGGYVIYYNSFETEYDSIGSNNYVGIIYSYDASPSGGKRSLYVSGGCIVPHVILIVPAQTEDGYYQLACWGKVLRGGGFAELITNSFNQTNHITVLITDESWNYYITSDSLYCPADTSMQISLISGGDNPCSMLVDQIKILKVR